jgi:hypothetical protein
MKLQWVSVEVLKDKVGAGPFVICEWPDCNELVISDAPMPRRGVVVFTNYGPTTKVKIYHQLCWIRKPGEMYRPLHEFLCQLQNNSGLAEDNAPPRVFPAK